MAQSFERIPDEFAASFEEQPVFFVATAPPATSTPYTAGDVTG